MLSIKDAFGFLKSAIQLGQAGQNTRSQMIEKASQLATAILVCAAQVSNRLNEALMTTDEGNKRNILSSLRSGEIQAFANINGLCHNIYSSANALEHWSTTEWANVNLGSHSDALRAFQILSDGEAGMQNLFTELMMMPGDLAQKSASEIDHWTRGVLGRMAEIISTANESAAELQHLL